MNCNYGIFAQVLNQAPADIAPSNSSVPENTTANMAIGTLSMTDVDV